ncbi:MMPL family transporter [Rothia aerolata]|uniref:RND superfamily drug exporter n=1 Tax=Rothia aerolata TaxID=1812262 RepID=A0A917IRN4_9MICC|nr:MMPL family transporter [Rothia aerolata]GGH61333.1 RND superfamily drug exporter [Rothia aerolata]
MPPTPKTSTSRADLPWSAKIKEGQPKPGLRVLIAALLVAVWVAVAGIGGPYFGKISEVSTNSSTDFLPESSEATRVAQMQGDFYDSDAAPAILIFESESEISARDKDYLSSLADELKTEGIDFDQASPVIYSDDGRAAQLILPLANPETSSDDVETIRERLASAPSSLESYVTGPAGFASDLSAAFAGIDGILLLVALAVVFVILLVVYRSPLLPILVLISSVMALSASIFVIWHMADLGWVKINGQVQGILLILVVGAATDYALLYVARYREALIRHQSRFAATREAWRGSLEPIAASGGTVIAGLLCLLFSQLASNTALGPVAATGIVFSMLASLTFLPAVLALFGRVAFWPSRPKHDPAALETGAEYNSKLWTRIADFVAAKPRAIWITCSLLLAVFALVSLSFRAEGVRQSELVLGGSESATGQEVLAEHFPGGSGTPANIVVDASEQDDAVAALDSDSGVSSVSVVSSDSPSGTLPVGSSAENLPPVFASASPTEVNGQVLLQATLADPADSPTAEDTVERLRSAFESAAPSALVGGETASDLDTITSAQRDRAVIIPIVLAVITLILMLLLRSVVAPVLLLVITVISYLASLGVAALLFNHVFDFPGADPTVPLYGFVFLVALGIDYTIFLMTRVREESLGLGTREGMRKGLIVTGGVITSAGIVLAATFAALAVIPLIFLVQLAFIVAFGVLLDATLVRAFLVPALVEDLGKKVWWPSKLSR